MPMKRQGQRPATDTRALEFALAAVAAYLAADAIRATLDPFWDMIKLLVGS